jgi:hypothetical protein
MSFENPLWGAPRIHGELLKLGIDVAQSTVSKYMVPRQGRPLQTWKTFLRNHVVSRDNLDENGASIWVRRGGRASG